MFFWLLLILGVLWRAAVIFVVVICLAFAVAIVTAPAWFSSLPIA